MLQEIDTGLPQTTKECAIDLINHNHILNDECRTKNKDFYISKYILHFQNVFGIFKQQVNLFKKV